MSDSDENVRGFELERLQRWMQAVMTHPGGVGSGVASSEARQSISVDTEKLETVVAPSATLSGAERLGVYWRSYHARLLQCFREMFPALLHALGESLFNMFALDYLQRHPPRSYTLDNLADDFAQHLAETRPEADAPPGERESWPDFIIELAAIEWAFLKIYDGQGVEGQTLPGAPDILTLGLERILAARLVPAPCLRLFAFRYPVHTYMLAVRRGEKPELPAPFETFVAATRVNYRVQLFELSATKYAFLKALDGQRTIDQALKQITHLADCQTLSAAAIQNSLCDWTASAFFKSIEVANDSAGLSQSVGKETHAPAGTDASVIKDKRE
jgi:hypothetical protein